MGSTSIEWTERTWNPVSGCSEISPGCANCYAKTFAERFRGVPGHPYEQGFDVKLWPERTTLPLNWKKPQMIFVNSMSDLFHEDIPFEFIGAVYLTMSACSPESMLHKLNMSSSHIFQVLTKRIDRAKEFYETHVFPNDRTLAEMPTLSNVWLGVSTEDQRRLEERVPVLSTIRAAVRWISAEPLIGPLNFEIGPVDDAGVGRDLLEDLDWVVIGGESGNGARPMDPEWAANIIEDCYESDVRVFMKQMGAVWAKQNHCTSKKGSIPSRWPEWAHIRQYPEALAA